MARVGIKQKRLIQMLSSPILWGQHYLMNRDGSPREYWPHQMEDLECKERNIIHLDGRGVGKSVCLTTDVLHFAFTNYGVQGLIAAPHQGHLDTLIEEIEFQIDSNPKLMASVDINKYGKPKIKRSPYFRLEFTNGSILYFRPAGAYGESFRSLHVERIWVDEGAWLTEKAWKALRQCLKAEGVLRIYSTPSGMRNTVYYRLTSSKQFKVFHWPSWINPDWNDERKSELLEFYGGPNSVGWQHEVAGEHGKPSYGAFNIEHLNQCRYEMPDSDEELENQDIPVYRKVSICGDDLSDCETEEHSYDRLELLLNLMPQTGVFWIGGDLGYTNDPTEIVVFQEMQIRGRPVTVLVLRLHLEHVSYPHIAQGISLLERYYVPAGIGVDNGGNGLAVVQELLTLDKYKSLQFEGRLKGYDFGGTTTLTTDDGREFRKRTKEHMTTLINGALQKKQLMFPASDSEIEDQFTTQTYTLANGNVIYSKGNDHIIDAVRCAMLAREQGNTEPVSKVIVVSLTPLLTDPIFD